MATQELLVRLAVDDASFSKKMKAVASETKLLDTQLKNNADRMKTLGFSSKDLAEKQKILGENTKLLSEKLKSNRTGFDESKRALGEFTQKFENAKGRVADFKQKLTDNDAELKKVKASMEGFGKSIDTSTKRVEGLERLKQDFEQCSQAIKKSEQAISENAQKLALAKKQYGELDTKVKVYGKDQDNLGKIIRRTKESYQKVGKETIEYARKITALEKELAKSVNMYGKNAEASQKLSAELKSVREQYTVSKEKARAYREELAKTSSLYKENKISLQGYQSKLRNLGSTITHLSSEEKQLKEELSKQKAVFDSCVSGMKKYDSAVTHTSLTLEKIDKALEKERQELAKGNKSYAEAEGRIKKLEDDYKSYSQQLDKARKEQQRNAQMMQTSKQKMEEYRGAVEKTTRALEREQMALKTAKLDHYQQKFTQAGNKIKGVGDKISGVGSKLTTGVSLPLGILGGVVASVFGGFEERVRKVNAVMQDHTMSMDTKYQKLFDSARKYGRETEWTAQQVAEGYEYMAMAGWDYEKSQKAMLPMLSLASIGMVDLGKATDIITDTITPFQKSLDGMGASAKSNGKDFDEARYTADLFAQTIASSNTNVEMMGETMKYCSGVIGGMGGNLNDTAVAIGLMANSSVKGSSSGTALATGLSRMAKGGGECEKAMAKYDVRLVKTKEGHLDLMGTMKLLRSKIGGITDETERASACAKLFGLNAQKGWLAIVNASPEAFGKMENAIKNCNGASEKMMEEISKSGAYSFKIMISSIQDLAIEIGNALAPAFVDIANKVGDFAKKLTDWTHHMQETNPELLKFIGKLVILGITVPPLISVFGHLVSGIGLFSKGIGGAFGCLSKVAKNVKSFSFTIGGMKNVLGAVGSAMGVTFPIAIGLAVVAIAGLIHHVGQSTDCLQYMQDQWGEAGTVIGRICESMSGAMNIVIGIVWELSKAIGKTMEAVFSGNFRKIPGIWEDCWNEMKYTTKKGWSDMKAETTNGIALMKKASSKELKEMGKDAETVFKAIGETTLNTTSATADVVYSKLKDMSEDQLTMIRGSSKQMSVALSGISAGMSKAEFVEQVKANLESMVKCGKISASQMETELKKFQDLIGHNMKDGAEAIKRDTEEILKTFEDSAIKSPQRIARETAEAYGKLSKETKENLKSCKGVWKELTADIKDDDTQDVVEQKMAKALENLQKTHKDLKGDIAKDFEEARGTIGKEAEQTVEDVNKKLNELKPTLAKVPEIVGSTTKDTIRVNANKVGEMVVGMNEEVANKLREGSASWKAILKDVKFDGSMNVTDMGKQIEKNFAEILKKNPELLKKYGNDLNEGLGNVTKAFDEQINKANEETKKKMEGDKKKAEETAKVCEATLKKITSVENGLHIGIGETKFNKLNDSILYTGTKLNELGQEATTTKTGLDRINNQSLDDIINETLREKTAQDLAKQSADANKTSLEGVDATTQTNVQNQTDTTTSKLNESIMAGQGAKQKLNEVDVTTQYGVQSQIDMTKNKLGETTVAGQGAKGKFNEIDSLSLGGIHKQIELAGEKTDTTRTKAENSKLAMKELGNLSFSRTHGALEGLIGVLGTVWSKAKSAFHSLVELSNMQQTTSSFTNNGYLSGAGDGSRFGTGNSGLSWFAEPPVGALENIPISFAVVPNFADITQKDMPKVKVSGGYYNQNTSHVKTSSSIRLASQNQQIEQLRINNHLQKQQINTMQQLLVAITQGQNISLSIDGRQVARATAPHMQQELNTITKRKNRLGGSF